MFVCSACENYVQRSSKIKQRIIFPVAKRRKLSLSCSKRKGLLPLSLMASKAVQDCGAAHRDCMCHKFGQHFFTMPQIETMLPKINTSTPHIKTTLLQFETKSCFVAVLSQFLVVWSRFVVEQSQFLVEQSRFVAAMSRFVTSAKIDCPSLWPCMSKSTMLASDYLFNLFSSSKKWTNLIWKILV